MHYSVDIKILYAQSPANQHTVYTLKTRAVNLANLFLKNLTWPFILKFFDNLTNSHDITIICNVPSSLS